MVPTPRETRVRGLETAASRHNAYAIYKKVQRGRDAAGSRRHGIAYPLKLHQRRPPDVHGVAQPVLGRCHRERFHARPLRLQAMGGDFLRGARGALAIHRRQPLQQLVEPLVSALLLGFEHSGGVPLRVVFDNPKTVVTGGDEHGRPIWNQTLALRERILELGPVGESYLTELIHARPMT
jgi:hypothetical protein